MKKLTYIFLSLILCLGCNNTSKEKKILNISFKMDPLTLDSRKSGDLVSSAALFLLFNGLTEFTKDGIKPALAKSYTISKDKKHYTFHLRDATWSDGKKITAYDFEYSWKKIIDPEFPSLCPHILYSIKNAEKAKKGKISLDEVGIKALDKKTLSIHLEHPTPYFLSLTSYCILFPVPKHIDEKFPYWESSAKHFVCSGPFTLKNWEHNNKIVLEKNPFYWNKNKIHLNGVTISIIDNENTALQMFENSSLDWVGALLSPIPLDSIPALMQKKEHTITSIGGSTFCAFNIEKPPFNNKNIRQAFSMAIDRNSIVKNITQAKESIATRFIPPILMQGKNLSLLEDNNPSKAKELFEKGLEELNLKKEDIKVTFSHGTAVFYKKQAEAIQEKWQKTFGIPIELEQVEEKVIYDRLHKHNFQVAISFWVVQYNDAMNIFERFKNKSHSKNYPNWESKKYISLLNLSDNVIDTSERIKALEEAEKILAEDMPLTAIHHHNYITLTKTNIKGIFIGPLGEMHFDKAYIK